VYLLFYQAENLKKENQIQQTSLERLAVQLEQVRNLYRNAQALAYDTLQVFNQTLQIGIQMQQTQRDLRLLNLQMAQLLNLPEVRPLADLALPALPGTVLQPDSVKQIARQQRPELRGVGLAQQAAQLNRKLARGNYFPEIGAEARYFYAKPGVNPFANEWMDYATFGMNLQWNLWRWNQDRHRMQTAEVEFDRLQLEEEELLRAIDYEVEMSWENMQLAAQQNRLAELLRAQQQERYRIIISQQREGLATTNDVVIAESDLTQAELQLQRTLVQYYVALAELQLAAGALGASH
jgi:outer membrane protein TolC